MPSKTHYKKPVPYSYGLTLVELVVVLSISLIIFGSVSLVIDPLSLKQKGRDNKRLSDISTLDRAVNEFMLDNKKYPDTSGVLRKSTILPVNADALVTSNFGWIQADLSPYISKLPIDPENNETFFYSYIHDDTSYEINAQMEIFTEKMTTDGGNDNARYEVGNNLLLISPVSP